MYLIQVSEKHGFYCNSNIGWFYLVFLKKTNAKKSDFFRVLTYAGLTLITLYPLLNKSKLIVDILNFSHYYCPLWFLLFNEIVILLSFLIIKTFILQIYNSCHRVILVVVVKPAGDVRNNTIVKVSINHKYVIFFFFSFYPHTCK